MYYNLKVKFRRQRVNQVLVFTVLSMVFQSVNIGYEIWLRNA